MTYLSLKPQGEADLEAQPNPSHYNQLLSKIQRLNMISYVDITP